MNTMMSWLLLLLLFVSLCSPAPRPSDKDICLLDNTKLQQRLKVLQDLLQLCELQLKDILENKYHGTKSKIFSARRNIQPEMLLPTTSGNLIVYDQDCSAVFNSKKTENGYYRIRPRADREPFLVYCDMSDGGGWTVIQRRSNGKENFNRKWDDYKQGFGQFKGKNDEYWLGNEHIYDLLVSEKNSLKIDLMDWQGEKRYAIYENFQIKNEQDNYTLWVGYYSGNAGDALSGGSNLEEQWSVSLSGMPFSTSDKDHDRFLNGNCAQENKCGWWFNRYGKELTASSIQSDALGTEAVGGSTATVFYYNARQKSLKSFHNDVMNKAIRCHAANLNGQYYKTGNYTGTYDNGVVWSTWHGLWYSLKYTAMKIRLPSFVDVGSGNGESS